MSTNKVMPGIVYMSSVPAGVTPTNLFTFLAHYGEVGRMHMTPADQGSEQVSRNTLRNRQNGFHNRGKMKLFKDAYVEFMDKACAKRAAIFLNGKAAEFMGRRSRGYGQLWNMRYMSGLKWEHLVEEREAERVSRRTAIVDEKKRMRDLNAAYYEKVKERQAMVEASKKISKNKTVETDENGDEAQSATTTTTDRVAKRRKVVAASSSPTVTAAKRRTHKPSMMDEKEVL
eukprot:PhM_4_TR5776/c0_g1_i1/m.90302/K14785/ESF2, ABT1; ESF2/ABP1 family protein